MINLVTSFYNKKSDDPCVNERNNEINSTLISNLKSESIKKIHLFLDDEYSLSILNNNIINGNEFYENKIVKLLHYKQAKYSDFFSYAYDNLKYEIVMISNSDIYLYSCCNYIVNKYVNEQSQILALTRHETPDYKPLIDNYEGSHDAFIFNSPIKEDIHMRSNFTQNNWGSENLVISLLVNNGYTLRNTCYQVIVMHNHKSKLRNDNRVRINNNELMHDYCYYSIEPWILD